MGTRKPWLTAGICAMAIGLDGFDSQALGFVAPALSRAWHLAPGALGPTFSAALIGMMIGALALGSLSDRFGRRSMIILGTMLFSAGALMTPLTHTLTQLTFVRFVTGIGLGGILPVCVAIISEVAPEGLRETLVMVTFSAISIGAALGGLAASYLLPRYGWSSVFVVGGMVPVLILPALIFGLPRSQAAGSRAPSEPSATRELFSAGHFTVTLLFWAVFLVNLLNIYFLNNWLPTLFAGAHLSTTVAILIAVLFQLGGAAGAFVLSYAVRRFGFGPALIGNFVLGGLAAWLLGWAGAAVVVLVPAALVAGACLIGGQGGCNAMAGAFYPAPIRGTGLGWALGISRVGSIIGPLLGGMMLAARIPVPVMFSGAAALQVCAALLIAIIVATTAWRGRPKATPVA